MESTSGTSGDSVKTTLADKLIASGNSAQSANITDAKVTEMTEEQLREFVDAAESSEKEYIDRVGRRLNTILEAVREAKNVAKPVQIALAEAIAVFKQVTGVRKQRLNAAERLKNLENYAGTRAVPTNTDGLVADPTEDSITRNMLTDIAHEVKALRQEVSDIRLGRDCSGNDADKGGTWVEVVKKKSKTSNFEDRTTAPLSNKAPEAKTRSTRPPVRQRPPAILIEAGEAEFPALVKKIRGGANREVIGDHVIGMRQTKAGGLLIQLKGDQQQIEAIRAEVSRSAGDDVKVRSLHQKTMLEIRDLDQWTDSEEVAGAVTAETGVDQDALKVISVRQRYGGTQAAVVLVPTASCQKMLTHGRIRVGMVSCRVRLAETKVRCFRCLGYGHISGKCNGPDRTRCCRRCGGDDHKAANCNATEQAASAFAGVCKAGEVESNKPNDA